MTRRRADRRESEVGRSSAGSRRQWPLEVRLRVARAVVDEGLSVADVARTFGVGTTTAAEWVRRYRARGVDGLAPPTPTLPRPVMGRDRDPRRPAVVAARQAHPEHGTRRIRDQLTRAEALQISETTVRRILHEAGLLVAPPAPAAPPASGRSSARSPISCGNRICSPFWCGGTSGSTSRRFSMTTRAMSCRWWWRIISAPR